MAAVMACGPGALLSHASAAALQRPAREQPRAMIDVTISVGPGSLETRNPDPSLYVPDSR